MGDISKRVLVVDDKEINRLSAKVLETQGYSIDTASGFLSATKILAGLSLDEVIKHPDRIANTRDVRHSILLIDLVFPFEGENCEFVNMRDDSFTRTKELPLGYALSLYTAKIGVPKITIITDMNHHASPISATFDLFYQSKGRQAFRINKSKLMMFNVRDFYGSLFSIKDGGWAECVESYEKRKSPQRDIFVYTNGICIRHQFNRYEDMQRMIAQIKNSGESELIVVKNWIAALDCLLNGTRKYDKPNRNYVENR